MTLQGQAIPTLEDNTCESNQQAGLLWLGSAAGMARRNRCAGNGAVGIQLQEQALPTLESNVCEGNQQGSIDCFGLTQFSALMASKSLGATKIDVALTTILTDCVPQADLFVRASIPAHKLANARVTCNVPAGEVILGLIDCTVFGSAKDALLFGAQGIYYRNIMVSTATTAIVGKLLYREFPNCQFKLDEKEIVLTPQKRCSLSGSEVPVLKACQILIAIRQFVMAKLQSGSGL